jgi:hypothetical protein
MGKKSGSGMKNPGHISERLETFVFDKKNFYADPGWKNLDPGWKKF